VRGPLVGLAGHPLLGQYGARGVVQGGQEVRRRILAPARSAHGLAVHRDHPAAVDGAGTRVEPGHQVGIEVCGVQVVQDPSDR